MAKKVLVKYLDLGDGRYIENDKVKYKVNESGETKCLSWDELWTGIKSDIEMVQKYVQEQNNKN